MLESNEEGDISKIFNALSDYASSHSIYKTDWKQQKYELKEFSM